MKSPIPGIRRQSFAWRAWCGLMATLLVGGCGHVRASAEPELPPLTTVSGSVRLPGKFVWMDLVTDDVPAARKFYGELFGWGFRDLGGYAIAEKDERPLGGIFQRARPKDRPEARPQWFGYISVPSVERAQRVVTKAGGRVLAGPRTMPKRGDQAVFADPEGAVFGVIKSGSGDPEDFLAEPGEWIWIQLLSLDGRKAAGFYRELAGYDIAESTTANSLSDYVLTSKGYARATVRTIRKETRELRPAWLPFIRVNSVSDCVARVEQLGGKVALAPSNQLLSGRLAVISDPTGAELGVMEWNSEMPKGGREP